MDLAKKPLAFQLDLSNVPCGCLACIYLVKMADPGPGTSNYCDMAENVRPGFDGEMCTELDLLEANNHAMQAAIHTELGGSYGSGQCDRNGCFIRSGGPQAPPERQGLYGQGQTIDSSRPFEVITSVDGNGAMKVTLAQGDGQSVTSFDRYVAGNPQGSGVPQSALSVTKQAMGKVALVASLWTSPDMSWVRGGHMHVHVRVHVHVHVLLVEWPCPPYVRASSTVAAASAISRAPRTRSPSSVSARAPRAGRPGRRRRRAPHRPYRRPPRRPHRPDNHPCLPPPRLSCQPRRVGHCSAAASAERRARPSWCSGSGRLRRRRRIRRRTTCPPRPFPRAGSVSRGETWSNQMRTTANRSASGRAHVGSTTRERVARRAT